MKKFIVLVCSFVLILTICACDMGGAPLQESSTAETSSFEDSSEVTMHGQNTAQPTVSEMRVVSDTRVVISGECEIGARVSVKYGGMSAETQSYMGSYILDFSAPGGWEGEISLSAVRKGKNASEPVILSLKVECEDPVLSDWVITGSNMRLFFSSSMDCYYRKNLLSDENIDYAKTEFTARITELKNKCDAELIYILAPNPNEIYYSDMPPAYPYPGEYSLHAQTVEILRSAGAAVIDMLPILRDHMDDEFSIYHRTDSHWTEYAAYFAYKELYDYISKDYPAAFPRDIEEFGFSNGYYTVGDLYTDLGMDYTKLLEYSTFSTLTFETPVDIPKYASSGGILIDSEPTQFHIFTNPKGEGMPNIAVHRDSYSVMMFDFMAERSKTMHLFEMWDFAYNPDYYEENDIDYVIYLICDMNLVNLYK